MRPRYCTRFVTEEKIVLARGNGKTACILLMFSTFGTLTHGKCDWKLYFPCQQDIKAV